MGLIEAIFGKKQETIQPQGFFKTVTSYTPAFTTFNGMIYESDLVRASIDATARHMSKLKVEFVGSAQPKLQTAARHRPNPWSTWSQYLYRITTILETQNTAFIVPVLSGDYDEITGYFPVLPSQCEILEYKDKPYLGYRFISGETRTIELDRCGIVNRFQYKSDFFGETNAALNRTMDLAEIQNKAIEEAVKNSNTFQFMAKASNFNKDTDLAKEQKRFKDSNLKGEGGVLLFPNTYNDIKQIDYKAYTVDKDQAEKIERNVFNYFGTNLKILQNTANGEELDAFFNGKIEPLSIQLAEVMSGMSYSDREMSSGSEVRITANRLQYMSPAQKIAMVQQLGDRGFLKIDEGRELFNFAPLPDGEGDRTYIRGEYYDTQDKIAEEKGDKSNE